MISPSLGLRSPARYPHLLLKCQRRTIPGEMSESGTPAALRCTAQCIPQLTKLVLQQKKPAATVAELVVETTGKRARFQTAQTVLSSRPAMPSNLNRRREASLKEARIQTLTPQHNVNKSSRRPNRQERAYSHCKKPTRPAAVCNFAAPPRQPCYHLC